MVLKDPRMRDETVERAQNFRAGYNKFVYSKVSWSGIEAVSR